jgi:hypothetical protein
MATAHTFPLSLGQKSMEYIFGEDAEDEINERLRLIYGLGKKALLRLS